jgi:hypothetical protein
MDFITPLWPRCHEIVDAEYGRRAQFFARQVADGITHFCGLTE